MSKLLPREPIRIVIREVKKVRTLMKLSLKILNKRYNLFLRELQTLQKKYISRTPIREFLELYYVELREKILISNKCNKITNLRVLTLILKTKIMILKFKTSNKNKY
jgi:hypothetical protein